MSRGFVLHFAPLDGSLAKQKSFAALPIRIGRNELNDCPLALNFVSDFHARLEEIDGRIAVRDLTSRNGVFILRAGNPIRLNPGSAVPLDECGNEFFIGPSLKMWLEVVEREAPADRDGKFGGTVLGNRRMIESNRESAAPAAPPGPLPSLGALPPLGGVPGVVSIGGPAQPARAYGEPQRPQPVYARDPAPQPPAPGRSSASTQHFQLSLETLALTGLKELAASLVPGQSIETTGDIARLITKLHDTVEVFCRCFIPLREGHAQFASSMDLNRAASQRSLHRSPGYHQVEHARTPAALAHALLDFSDQSTEGPRAIEGILADLMVHQVALLDGVMRGVQALLVELSPENIERAVDAERSVPLNIGRYKALWAAFAARYDELSDEKQALMRIFGPEFSEAYREYGRKKRPSVPP